MLNIVRNDTQTTGEKSVDKLDKIGATASFLCAIHCALLPLVVTLLPLLGLSFLASEPVEWALLLASATLGTLSICLGFKEHRSRKVFAVLGVALALLVAGRLFHVFDTHPLEQAHSHSHDHAHEGGFAFGPMLMVLGGFAMMGAHVFNHYLCRSCRRCAHEHETDAHASHEHESHEHSGHSHSK